MTTTTTEARTTARAGGGGGSNSGAAGGAGGGGGGNLRKNESSGSTQGKGNGAAAAAATGGGGEQEIMRSGGDVAAEFVDVIALWDLLIAMRQRRRNAVKHTTWTELVEIQALVRRIMEAFRVGNGGNKWKDLGKLIETLLDKQLGVQFDKEDDDDSKEANDWVIDFSAELPFVLNRILISQQEEHQSVKEDYYPKLRDLMRCLAQVLPSFLFAENVKQPVVSSVSPPFAQYLLSTSETNDLASRRKVVVVGYGRVGKAIVNELLLQNRFRVVVVLQKSNSRLDEVSSEEEEIYIPGADIRYVSPAGEDTEVLLEEMRFVPIFESALCVISTLPYNLAGTVLEEQIALAAKAANVEQFIPSYFVPNHRTALPLVKESILVAKKGEFLDNFLQDGPCDPNAMEEPGRIKMNYTAISIGIIADYWFGNPDFGYTCTSRGKTVECTIYGIGDQSMSYITLADLARSVVAVIGRRDLYDTIVECESFSISPLEIASVVEKLVDHPITRTIVEESKALDDYSLLINGGNDDPDDEVPDDNASQKDEQKGLNSAMKLIVVAGFKISSTFNGAFSPSDIRGRFGVVDTLMGALQLTSSGNAEKTPYSFNDLRNDRILTTFQNQVSSFSPSFSAALVAARNEYLLLQNNSLALLVLLHEAATEAIANCCTTVVELFNFSEEGVRRLSQQVGTLNTLLAPLRTCEAKLILYPEDYAMIIEESLQHTEACAAGVENALNALKKLIPPDEPNTKSKKRSKQMPDEATLNETIRLVQIAIISWAKEHESHEILIRAYFIECMQKRVAFSGGFYETLTKRRNGQGIGLFREEFAQGSLIHRLLLTETGEEELIKCIEASFDVLREAGMCDGIVNALADSLRLTCTKGEFEQMFEDIVASDGNATLTMPNPFFSPLSESDPCLVAAEKGRVADNEISPFKRQDEFIPPRDEIRQAPPKPQQGAATATGTKTTTPNSAPAASASASTTTPTIRTEQGASKVPPAEKKSEGQTTETTKTPNHQEEPNEEEFVDRKKQRIAPAPRKNCGCGAPCVVM